MQKGLATPKYQLSQSSIVTDMGLCTSARAAEGDNVTSASKTPAALVGDWGATGTAAWRAPRHNQNALQHPTQNAAMMNACKGTG